VPFWEEKFLEKTEYYISDECNRKAWYASMFYEEAVKLHYDLIMERMEDAWNRVLTADDILPQIEALRELTTKAERVDLVTTLGKVRNLIRDGDRVGAAFCADMLVATARAVLFNIIVRCEMHRWGMR